jgi:hypothetical protein
MQLNIVFCGLFRSSFWSSAELFTLTVLWLQGSSIVLLGVDLGLQFFGILVLGVAFYCSPF